MSSCVLDASALLAFLNEEAGADVVERALGDGAWMSAANWAEVMTKVVEVGLAPHEMRDELERLGIFGQALRVVPVTEEDAMEIARLRPLTRAQGLSLGDRACLALGQRLNLPVITADRAWAGLSLGIEVQQLR
ncbi:type II toxin-antitoxin system VapC family toxin [Sorangium sp. So ce216]